MSAFIDRVISDDFLWDAIVSRLPGKQRRSGTNFINVNCPLCVLRGESSDTRQRLGLRREGAHKIGFFCFNCRSKGNWNRGDKIPYSFRELLTALGTPDVEIKRLNLKAISYRNIVQSSPLAMSVIPDLAIPSFNPVALPLGSKPISLLAEEGFTDANYIAVLSYLLERGNDLVDAWDYHWSPSDGWKRRLIIPFRHDGSTVGYTGRAIDPGVNPRYLSESQPNYLFNARSLTAPNRKYVILAEGVFDAIALDAVGLMGARLNVQQVAWIKTCGKQVILLPDRDKAGSSLIDTALANNWMVAFPALRAGHGRDPFWEADVKDAAEACKRYGRIYTLMSVINSAESSKIKISQLRKLFI